MAEGCPVVEDDHMHTGIYVHSQVAAASYCACHVALDLVCIFMISRVTRTAYVCLRCQSRLLRNESPFTFLPSSSRIAVRGQRRQQSTAAAQVEEEDVAEERPRPSGSRTGFRTWRPAPVAELGVNALGKPAEVLLLEQRDRKIPEPPEDDDKEHKPQLLAALQAEAQPLNADLVRTNIELVREPHGQPGQELSQEQWLGLIQSLTKGFKTSQLVEYMRTLATEDEKSVKEGVRTSTLGVSTQKIASIARALKRSKSNADLRSRLQWTDKRGLSAYIISEMWCMRKPVDETEMKALGQSTVSLRPLVLKTILAQQQQPLSQLSEEFGVKIDVFQTQKKLVIGGGNDAVARAKAAVATLQRQIQCVKLDLGLRKHFFLDERLARFEGAFLEVIGRKRHVHIEQINKDGKLSFNIYYLQSEKRAAEECKRDLLLGARPSKPPSASNALLQANDKSNKLLPYRSRHATSWVEAQVSWERWCRQRGNAAFPKDSGSQEQRDSHPSPTSNVWRHLKSSTLFPELAASPETRCVYSAVIGQVLFVKNERPLHRKALEKSGLSKIEPALSTDVPLLAQYLTGLLPFQNSEKPGRSKREVLMGFNRAIHRLRLCSAGSQNLWPDIEVLLEGDDANKGLRQPLRIRNISAIAEERRYNYLLPDLPVDIQFNKRTHFDFYVAGRKQEPQHRKLNQQILAYLSSAQGQDEQVFAPFVKLTLPEKLTQRVKEKVKASAASEKSDKLQQTGPSKSVVTADTDKSGPKLVQTEYTLAALETVDCASYALSSSKDICLDHINLHDSSGGGDFQQLRLGRQSAFDLPEDDTSQEFPTLFTAACELASKLGKFSVNRTA